MELLIRHGLFCPVTLHIVAPRPRTHQSGAGPLTVRSSAPPGASSTVTDRGERAQTAEPAPRRHPEAERCSSPPVSGTSRGGFQAGAQLAAQPLRAQAPGLGLVQPAGFLFLRVREREGRGRGRVSRGLMGLANQSRRHRHLADKTRSSKRGAESIEFVVNWSSTAGSLVMMSCRLCWAPMDGRQR